MGLRNTAAKRAACQHVCWHYSRLPRSVEHEWSEVWIMEAGTKCCLTYEIFASKTLHVAPVCCIDLSHAELLLTMLYRDQRLELMVTQVYCCQETLAMMPTAWSQEKRDPLSRFVPRKLAPPACNGERCMFPEATSPEQFLAQPALVMRCSFVFASVMSTSYIDDGRPA